MFEEDASDNEIDAQYREQFVLSLKISQHAIIFQSDVFDLCLLAAPLCILRLASASARSSSASVR